MGKRGLTAAFVRTVKEPGKYGDQHGLMLRVMPSGSKQWVWRGTMRGKRVDMGLGGFPYTSLAEAREKAFEYRKLTRAGEDPRELKRSLDVPTFAEAAEKVLEIHRPTWKNPRSGEIWFASLRDYVFPALARKRVSDINTTDIMGVLLPIWTAKADTARRVRRRIGTVMKWAIAGGYRADNPAGEAISAALPKSNGPAGHFRALPYSQVGAAIEKIRQSGAYIGTKLAFEFLVLTATRSGEVRGAKWSEINLEGRVWIIPGERMKTGREFRVPLSGRAIEILSESAEYADGSGLVFPSLRGRVLSDATLSKLAKENGIKGTPHGMRSSFRDWCVENGVSREVAEASLAHVVGSNKIERAYLRSTLLDLRRVLMEKWADFLNQS